MKNIISLGAILASVFIFTGCATNTVPSTSDGVVCTMEAKLCADGSYVGRTGPKCEFAPCPAISTEQKPPASKQPGDIALNKEVTLQGISIKPLEVLQDSRCPQDVQCIQAGTVVLRVSTQINGVNGTQTLTLGEPLTLGDKQITLVAVSPQTNSKKTISPEDYRFSFMVVSVDDAVSTSAKNVVW